MVKCPKCNKDMERLEFQTQEQSHPMDSLILYFICDNCRIYIEKTYNKFVADKK